MEDTTKSVNVDMEDKSNITKYYCFGCLGDNNERKIENYTFLSAPLKEIFQMRNISLCYLCKRMAHHTERFIKNVQSNQTLLENFCNSNFYSIKTVLDETLNTVRSQTQPLVKLQQVSFDVLEMLEKDSDTCEESFSVMSNKREDVKEDLGVELKFEMKEEVEMLDNLEAEFVNGDDEFPEMYVKEEDYPLNATLKEEIDISSIDNIINITSSLKKKLKKKERIKREDDKKLYRGVPKIKAIYLTRQQCMDERLRTAEDPKYLGFAYKCALCLKGFSFKGSYDKHMENHNQCMGEFECDICKQRTDTEEKLVGHMRYHFIRFKCPECGIKRKCRTTIKEHYSAYHLSGDHYYSCTQCLKKFKRQVSLRKHTKYAHGDKERVQCAYCERTYVNKSVLKSHMMVKHAKEVSAVEVCKKLICQECGARFKNPSQLRNHSIKHSDNRDYYCVECDKSFKSAYILRNHLKTAAIHVSYKELPLSCPHCEKRFSIRRDLDRHMNRIHLNIKPFRCDSCDKAYSCSWGLKEHKKNVHEGYKRPLQYPCPMCDKIFTRNQILKSHIRTHTGERPYKCPKCPAEFSQASILRTHDRLIHLKLTRDGRPKTVAMK